jgi:hypothetical protein
MSGFRNFVVAGSGNVGGHIIRELLKFKKAGEIDNVTVLTRTVSYHNTGQYLNSRITSGLQYLG